MVNITMKSERLAAGDRRLSPVSSPPTREALGQSEAFIDFQEQLSRVAPVERPVLILGERGTGKELAANRLHFLSRRWQEPLVTLNCAMLSPTLIESELFGHEQGAFTGAAARRQGRFEAANRGTLFLDEIGAIPLVTQEKILRVVEYGTFERVGSSSQVEVDVRIIGATNADLQAMAAEGSFKPDLLDRLSFEVLFLPPLRTRQGDIMLLANAFASRMAYELEREYIPTFSREAAEVLNGHAWPGNIRELKNVVERTVYRTESERLTRIALDPFESPYMTAAPTQGTGKAVDGTPPLPGATDKSFRAAVRQMEVSLLGDALLACRFNQRKAARMLGLSYDQFRGLKRKYGSEMTAYCEGVHGAGLQ